VRAARRIPGERLEDLLGRVARGDESAFEQVYQRVAGVVFGTVLRVLRDHAQSEEVTREVMVDLWRTASRFEAVRGSALAWALTMARRRAVDRVRSERAARERERRAGWRDLEPAHDQVAETVQASLEREAVHGCLGRLTELQRESVILAYYGGHTYREVAELLDLPLGTVKSRLRDGLIRLRAGLAVAR